MATNGEDVIARLERVEKKVDILDKKVDTLDKRVNSLDKKVDEQGNATRIQFEKVREDIKKLGEGYEQGLKQIARQLTSLNAKWSEKWTPHDIALKDHGKRITALEQRHK